MGRIETISHSDTICESAQLRKLSVTAVVCTEEWVCGGRGKFQYAEVCTTCTSHYDLNDGYTYSLVFGKSLFFVESLYKLLVPPNQFIANGHFFDDVTNPFTNGNHYMGNMRLNKTSPSHYLWGV